MTIAFIACSKSKRATPCTAERMYTGGLFRKSLALARLLHHQVYVLSAKHGVLPLDQVIEPYDLTLNAMTKDERERWTEMVRGQMRERGLKPPYVFLTGEEYCRGLDGERPMKGLGMGRRLAWLTAQLQKRKGFNL